MKRNKNMNKINEYNIDYSNLELKIGLEVHQQLNTIEKLHCHCKNNYNNNEIKYKFIRYLYPKSDQEGNVDIAAIDQIKSHRKYSYLSHNNNCLVELDETYPFPINKDALDISLIIAKYLSMDPVDTIHVMRKIIIDGSTTSGFQRTSFIAGFGFLNTDFGNCRISSLCLEEDSCTKIDEKDNVVMYSTDRLGTPLVEITTEPDINSPNQAYYVAKEIGMILRSTGKVRRGKGTIRQDINISIKNGGRVEIKGVQDLESIPKLIETEIIRQLNLLELKNIFKLKKVEINKEIIDCTNIFQNTKSKILRNNIDNNGVVLCISIKNGNGIFKYNITKEKRFGTELSDIIKSMNIAGLFHTDELPNYGITKKEIDDLYQFLDIDMNYSIIIISGKRDKVLDAFHKIISRIDQVFVGIPNETRKALENNNTSYLRPLPGPYRMYPETDLKPIHINKNYFESINIPELIKDKINRYQKQYNLSKEISERIAYSIYSDRFEKLINNWNNNIITPNLIANIFMNIFQELKRENLKINIICDSFLNDLFISINNKEISKEAIKDILIYKCKNENFSLNEIKKELMLISNDDLIIESIKKLVDEKKEYIFENKDRSIKPLMGILMKKYRGKIDGKKINDLLKENVYLILNQK